MTGAQRDTRNAVIGAAAATAVGVLAIWLLYQVLRFVYDNIWIFGILVSAILAALVAAFVFVAIRR